jgi:hypothetical protein
VLFPKCYLDDEMSGQLTTKGDVWSKRGTMLKSKFQARNLIRNTESVKQVLLIFTAGIACGLS